MPAIKFRASGCSLNRGSGFTVRFGVKAKVIRETIVCWSMMIVIKPTGVVWEVSNDLLLATCREKPCQQRVWLQRRQVTPSFHDHEQSLAVPHCHIINAAVAAATTATTMTTTAAISRTLTTTPLRLFLLLLR